MKAHHIAICGSGTMGSGIALVCARAGFSTLLFDVQPEALQRAEEQHGAWIHAQLSKQNLTEEQAAAMKQRLSYSPEIREVKAGIIIEAIVEKMPVKTDLFRQLAEVNGPSTIFASNTSSLSIAELAGHLPHPERVAGLHFFNPAPLMKLVEIVQAPSTSQETIDALSAFTEKLGKEAVICKDAPGFIVNRVARHYYLEALRIAEQTGASFESLDEALENAGFRMGPFRLMDLIGNDVNYAVTTSLYEACGRAKRFEPSPLQGERVEKNELGRKTGRGFYKY